MTMMLALTMKEVQSLGNILTFRLSENRAQTLPHLGKQKERLEREGVRENDRGRKRRRSMRGNTRDCS